MRSESNVAGTKNQIVSTEYLFPRSQSQHIYESKIISLQCQHVANKLLIQAIANVQMSGFTPRARSGFSCSIQTWHILTSCKPCHTATQNAPRCLRISETCFVEALDPMEITGMVEDHPTWAVKVSPRLVDDPMYKWRFPEMGGTHPSYHQFDFRIFHEMNHPAIRIPPILGNHHILSKCAITPATDHLRSVRWSCKVVPHHVGRPVSAWLRNGSSYLGARRPQWRAMGYPTSRLFVLIVDWGDNS